MRSIDGRFSSPSSPPSIVEAVEPFQTQHRSTFRIHILNGVGADSKAERTISMSCIRRERSIPCPIFVSRGHGHSMEEERTSCHNPGIHALGYDEMSQCRFSGFDLALLRSDLKLSQDQASQMVLSVHGFSPRTTVVIDSRSFPLSAGTKQ
jgi:hypothetical protein